jgi:hypothetical protein
LWEKLLAVGMIVALTGGGEPRLDGSSEEAMKASAAKSAQKLVLVA